MANSIEKNGILIIFESDGCKWASHFRNLLENEPYGIPTHTEHWWNLNGRDAMTYPVHVLVLTPLMENQIRHEKLSHLRNDSVTSLLLECNVDSKKLDMPVWRVVETIDVSQEKQRSILTALVEMFELATDDEGSFSSSEPIPIDIVPTCLYPGDKTIYIMMSEEPEGEVTIKLEGVPKRLPTKKHTKNSYTCELPETDAGQKTISVYAYSGYSLYTTKIVIVSAEMLMDNFIENLKDTLGLRSRSSGLQDWDTLWLAFNPFSEISFPKNKQIQYARLTKDIIDKGKVIDRDSGLSYDSIDDDPCYSSLSHFDELALNNDQTDRRGSYMREIPLRESFSAATLPPREVGGSGKSKGFGRFFKKLWRPKSDPATSYYAGSRKTKSSRRSRIARSQNFFGVPDLPPENTIVYESKRTPRKSMLMN